MADIKWSAEAKRDLLSIAEYYEVSSPEFSRYILGELIDSVEYLQLHPLMGRMVAEIELESFRELVVAGYRIIYLIQDSSVEILSIVHGRKDLFKHLKKR